MIRVRTFRSTMTWLALAATLLMAFAPVVSRVLQAQPGQQLPTLMAQLCTSAGLRWMSVPATPTDHWLASDIRPEQADPHRVEPGQTRLGKTTPDQIAPGRTAPGPATSDQAPDPDHPLHDAACDYCLLAGQVLPWLAVLVVFGPLLRTPGPALAYTVPPARTLAWRAHPARGPPRVF